ncbi:hypothetical protein NUW58_g10676 [Xylaria curta]|uniref:Uncharacterized protein n=1 Tax=Xylaria curta TaxID=42375 RepID=A0ACC1MI87_9PEZI|nr:hypothetical protein NUW58_g10676 [Xylaria curta]
MTYSNPLALVCKAQPHLASQKMTMGGVNSSPISAPWASLKISGAHFAEKYQSQSPCRCLPTAPVLEASNLVRLLFTVQKHEPSQEPPSRLSDEADRLHPAPSQIEINKDGLNDPSSEKLNEDSNSRVPSEGVGELEQPDWTIDRAFVLVQSYDRVSNTPAR